LSTEPLKPILDLMGVEKLDFPSWSTSCRRNYIGIWEIENDKLFLIDLKAHSGSTDEVSIDVIFPNQKKVFAEWFSGEIKIPQGKMLHYEHMGYMSIYEKDLFLEFKKGVLLNKREVDNTKTFDPDDPTGIKRLLLYMAEEYTKNLKKDRPPESSGEAFSK
jgi:hypothetical protein